MPAKRKRYTVMPLPNDSEEKDTTHFVVYGPGLDFFSEMDRLGKIMEDALNDQKPKPKKV